MALGQGVQPGSVGADWVGNQEVASRRLSEFSALTGADGAAAMASVMPSDRMFSARQGDHDGQAGKSACHQRPDRTPLRASARWMLPSRRRLGDACRQEGERRLEDDGVCHEGNREHQNRGRAGCATRD
jgi:hypothetical protein